MMTGQSCQTGVSTTNGTRSTQSSAQPTPPDIPQYQPEKQGLQSEAAPVNIEEFPRNASCGRTCEA